MKTAYNDWTKDNQSVCEFVCVLFCWIRLCELLICLVDGYILSRQILTAIIQFPEVECKFQTHEDQSEINDHSSRSLISLPAQLSTWTFLRQLNSTEEMMTMLTTSSTIKPVCSWSDQISLHFATMIAIISIKSSVSDWDEIIVNKQ